MTSYRLDPHATVLIGSIRERADSAIYTDWRRQLTGAEVEQMCATQRRTGWPLLAIGQRLTGHRRGFTYAGHIVVERIVSGRNVA